jgi:hypothetical protein
MTVIRGVLILSFFSHSFRSHCEWEQNYLGPLLTVSPGDGLVRGFFGVPRSVRTLMLS